MARSKTIPGSKTTRANKRENPQQGGVSPNLPEVNHPEANASGSTAAAVAPDVKVASDTNRALESNAPSHATLAANLGSESKGISDGRKFEVVKTESRKNLVPINLEDEIRRRAYELYERRGSGSGSEAEDWFTAEREVRQRYRQQSA